MDDDRCYWRNDYSFNHWTNCFVASCMYDGRLHLVSLKEDVYVTDDNVPPPGCVILKYDWLDSAWKTLLNLKFSFFAILIILFSFFKHIYVNFIFL